MSHPSDRLLRQLSQVSEELQEVFAERGHRVDLALEADEAFGSTAQSKTTLMRELALDAVAAAASRVGVQFGAVNGSGRELRTFDDGVDRRFRVRRASRDSDGNIVLMANSDAPLRVVVDEGDGLYPVEAWAFGWVPVAEAVLVAEVFVAPILDFVPGNPGHLVLGRAISLLGPDTPSGGGFTPRDEGLDGFDDDEVDEVGGDTGVVRQRLLDKSGALAGKG